MRSGEGGEGTGVCLLSGAAACLREALGPSLDLTAGLLSVAASASGAVRDRAITIPSIQDSGPR